MTATTAPRPGDSRLGGQAPAPPRPLLGMYALTAIVLCCVAACAGQIVFLGDLSLSQGPAGAINQCGSKFPVTASALANLGAFQRCAAGAMRSQGFFILEVIGAFLLAAAALSVIVPWAEVRRLARAVPIGQIPGVAGRFRWLCAESGLTGRRVPRLQVAGLGRPVVRQAFTTASPWGRPLVVLPAKVAVAREHPDRFDPVVLHELAHVRARDVSWVSSVRGVTWLTIPVMALACVPGLLNSQGARIPGTVLVQAGLFVVVTVAFAAGLLRLRELEADRVAAQWLGSPESLGHVLNAGPPRPSAGWGAVIRSLARPLERHPSARARVSALHRATGSTGTDLAYPFAVGVVVALAINTAYYLTWTLDFQGGGWPPVGVAAGVGSVVLGFGLTPGLIRQAAAARRAGPAASWWRPVAGTAAGLLLGLLVPPSTSPGPALSLVGGAGLEYEAVKILLTVAAGAGVATLAAGIASLAAAAQPRRVGRWLTAWASLAVSSTAAAALWPIINPGTGSIERLFLTLALPDIQWRWLAVPYPATVLMIGVPLWQRRVRRPAPPQAGLAQHVRAALAPVVIPACAAIVAATVFLPHSLVRRGASGYAVLQVVDERWWVCTLAGWVVLVVLTLGQGVPGIARAWVSAWAATLLAGAELVIYGIFHGHAPSLAVVSQTITTPSVWLFYLSVPTASLALLATRPRAARTSRWLLPAFASFSAVAIVIAIISLARPLTTISFGPPSPPSPPAPRPSQPLIAADPGRVLTASAARLVIADVSAALSGSWTGHLTVATGPADSVGAPTPPVSPTACRPLAREEFVSYLRPAVVRAIGQYRAVPGMIPIGNATLTMMVESYSHPVPSVMFAAASHDLRACHRFTVTTPAGTSVFTVHDAPPLRLRVPSWQAEFSVAYKNTRSSVTWIFIGVRHNLIILTQQTIAFGTLLPLQQTAIKTALSAALSGLSHIPASLPRS